MEQHQYFREQRGPLHLTRSRAVAAYILNRYLSDSRTVSKWRATRPYTIQWGEPSNVSTARIDYLSLVQQLHQRGKVSMERYGLPLLMSPVFDQPSTDIGLGSAAVGSDGKTVRFNLDMQHMGAGFPLRPSIDREGIAIADMQTLVELNIAALFRKLVANSSLAPQPRSGWLTDFRLLVSECVTAVDMMLHKVHLLAQHRAADLGWKFDEQVMGTRNGTRLVDKFRWLSFVSGHPFALEPLTHRAFVEFKELRNHLTHFDPPCFSATLAEFGGWLNGVHDVADVLFAIRRHLKQQLSESTVELLMLPRVTFHGLALFDRTVLPHDGTIGYRSASW